MSVRPQLEPSLTFLLYSENRHRKGEGPVALAGWESSGVLSASLVALLSHSRQLVWVGAASELEWGV